jgi:hypothetical protein
MPGPGDGDRGEQGGGSQSGGSQGEGGSQGGSQGGESRGGGSLGRERSIGSFREDLHGDPTTVQIPPKRPKRED